MDDVRARSAGVIIAFPDVSGREPRLFAGDEPRGEILLFTGVRYERMQPDSGPRPIESDGHSRKRRRRS